MQETYPPRPAWNHNVVQDFVAEEFADEVKQWADECGVLSESDSSDPRMFLAMLALALRESPDSYQAGRYIEDFWGWPVSRELISILDRAYNRMRMVVRKFVLEWVVANNVRFPAKKGEGVRFRIGEVEFGGVVLDVIRPEAKGIVRLNIKNGKSYSVNAEDVIQVTSPAAVKEKS